MKTKIIVIVSGSFVAGLVAGFLWAGHAFKKFEVSKEVDVAAQTAYDANTLAMLRLNEATNAIAALEMQADAALAALAVWDRVSLPDEKTRAQRDRWLTGIKVYHQNFPVQGNDTNMVALVNAFLEKIPGRSPTNTCQSALCRLDDLRLAAAAAQTKAVAK